MYMREPVCGMENFSILSFQLLILTDLSTCLWSSKVPWLLTTCLVKTKMQLLFSLSLSLSLLLFFSFPPLFWFSWDIIFFYLCCYEFHSGLLLCLKMSKVRSERASSEMWKVLNLLLSCFSLWFSGCHSQR